jgi:hypothetical protein
MNFPKTEKQFQRLPFSYLKLDCVKQKSRPLEIYYKEHHFVNKIIIYMYKGLFEDFGSEEYHISKVPGLGYTYHHDTIKVFYHNVPYNK